MAAKQDYATTTQDYTKTMKDMMGAVPVDMSAFQNAYKSQAAFAEKMSRVMFEAADKSTEISARWTKDTIGKMGDVTAVKEEPADYGRALTDFASAQAELASENLAAYAEVAKKVQMETVELMLAAGKNASEDATSAMKKAGNEMTAAAKKAANAA